LKKFLIKYNRAKLEHPEDYEDYKDLAPSIQDLFLPTNCRIYDVGDAGRLLRLLGSMFLKGERGNLNP
jgi:hypothetical protein